MKYFIILALVTLAGCSNSYNEVSFPARPKELADCKFYNLSNDRGSSITVLRCPNSSTSTSYVSGRVKKDIIVIDGVEYSKVNDQ